MWQPCTFPAPFLPALTLLWVLPVSLLAAFFPPWLPADYLKKIIVKGLSSATTPVSKIMTAADKLAVLTPEHSVLEAMDLMLRYNVRHVPVVSCCPLLLRLRLRLVVVVVVAAERCRG